MEASESTENDEKKRKDSHPPPSDDISSSSSRPKSNDQPSKTSTAVVAAAAAAATLKSESSSDVAGKNEKKEDRLTQSQSAEVPRGPNTSRCGSFSGSGHSSAVSGTMIATRASPRVRKPRNDWGPYISFSNSSLDFPLRCRAAVSLVSSLDAPTVSSSPAQAEEQTDLTVKEKEDTIATGNENDKLSLEEDTKLSAESVKNNPLSNDDTGCDADEATDKKNSKNAGKKKQLKEKLKSASQSLEKALERTTTSKNTTNNSEIDDEEAVSLGNKTSKDSALVMVEEPAPANEADGKISIKVGMKEEKDLVKKQQLRKRPRSQEILEQAGTATENDEISVPKKDDAASNKRSKAGSTVTSVSRKTKAGSGGSSKNRRKSAPQKSSKIDYDKEFSTSWICCECREAECLMQPDADTLMICEGTCRRLFHYPCAGLNKLPEDEFVCNDCRVNKFRCAVCQNYGQGGVDVFRCNQDRCGIFYHQACLVLREINFTLVPVHTLVDTDKKHKIKTEKESEKEIKPMEVEYMEKANTQTAPVEVEDGGVGREPVDGLPQGDLQQVRPDFKCPAHCCWTCSFEFAVKEGEEALHEHLPKAKRGKKNERSLFERRLGPLVRCLECPISFHVPCIPPAARFHELAILCHEHALTHKLPELDTSYSIQGKLEAKMDERFKNMGHNDNRPTRRNSATKRGRNKFFGGLSGATVTKSESRLLQELLGLAATEDASDDEEQRLGKPPKMGLLPFCLPCDIKDDVYSKPPPYKHVHTLKYNKDNKPQRLPQSEEKCSCVGFCGDDCLNRMIYVECVGDKDSRKTNCAVGKECGNRRLGRRQFLKCKPMREQGRGWGLVTCGSVKAGDLVIEYVGEVIAAATKEKRLEQWIEEHPNDPNFYVMSLSKEWYIDAREVSNLSRFINHSCQPNCSLTTINVDGYMRNGIFALVDIEPGQFLSYDYRFDKNEDKDNKFICRCGAPKCRGSLKNKEEGRNRSSVFQGDLVLHRIDASQVDSWEHAKNMLTKDQAFIDEYEKQKEERMSQVDLMVPASTAADEFVSNGVQKRFRLKFTPKVFLWRNAKLGSNLEKRLNRLKRT